MKVLIVDDEAHARQNLKRRLINLDPKIIIIGEAKGVDEAITILKQNQPDILFLDIEMPDKNGFDLIESLDQISFEVVFVTAYNQYALKAFEQLALAYITKPIDNDLLVKAYEKAKANRSSSHQQDLLKALSAQLSNFNSSGKIAIPVDKGLKMVDVKDIMYAEASEGYSIVWLNDKSKVISSKRLSYYEIELEHLKFYRIHRSYVINVNHVSSYSKAGHAVLSNGITLPVSNNYKKGLQQRLKGLV